ncbi:hypothetical protein [Halohasta litorea]|uniref:hypothetical protein n=1 Tax=Halohasta litorea TaxID=869891 RepID=UPI00211116DA|nr:hypothetical protein [Halohasta litorea]
MAVGTLARLQDRLLSRGNRSAGSWITVTGCRSRVVGSGQGMARDDRRLPERMPR